MAVSEKNEQELNRLNEEGKIQQDSMNRERREDIDGFRQGNKSIEDIERLFSDEEILEVCRESPLYEGLVKAAPLAGGLKVFESLKERIGLLGAFKPELLVENINNILLNMRDNLGRDYGIFLENNGTIDIKKTTARCRELYGEVPKAINDYIRTENIRTDLGNNYVLDKYTLKIDDATLDEWSKEFGFSNSEIHRLIDTFNEAWSSEDKNYFKDKTEKNEERVIKEIGEKISAANLTLKNESNSQNDVYKDIAENGFTRDVPFETVRNSLYSAKVEIKDEKTRQELMRYASTKLSSTFEKQYINNGMEIGQQVEGLETALKRVLYYKKIIEENPNVEESYKEDYDFYLEFLKRQYIVKEDDFNLETIIDSINTIRRGNGVKEDRKLSDFVDENGNLKTEHIKEIEDLLEYDVNLSVERIKHELMSKNETELEVIFREIQSQLKEGERFEIGKLYELLAERGDPYVGFDSIREIDEKNREIVRNASKELNKDRNLVFVKLIKNCSNTVVSNTLTEAFEKEYGPITEDVELDDDMSYVYRFLLKENKFNSRIESDLEKFRNLNEFDKKIKRGIGIVLSTLGMLEEIDNAKINYKGMSETRERCMNILAEIMPEGIVENNGRKDIDKNEFLSNFNKMVMLAYKDNKISPIPVFKKMEDLFSWCKERSDNNISFLLMGKLMADKADIGNMAALADAFDKQVLSEENQMKIDKFLAGTNMLNYQKMTLTDVLGGYEGVLDNDTLKIFGDNLSKEDNKILSAMSLVLKYDSPDKMGLMNLSSDERLDVLVKNESDRLKVEVSIRDAKRYLQQLMPNMRLSGDEKIDREQLAKEFGSLIESRSINIPQTGNDILESLTNQLENAERQKYNKTPPRSSVFINNRLEKVVNDADKRREKNINILAISLINSFIKAGEVKPAEASEYLELLEKNHQDLFEGENLHMYLSDETHSSNYSANSAILRVEALKKSLWKLSGYEKLTDFDNGIRLYKFENNDVGKEDLKQKLLYCVDFYAENANRSLAKTDLFKGVKKEVDLMIQSIDPSLINSQTGKIDLRKAAQIISDNDINSRVKKHIGTLELIKMAKAETSKLFLKQLRIDESNGIPMSKSFSESYNYLKENLDYDEAFNRDSLNRNISRLLMFDEKIEHVDKSNTKEYSEALKGAVAIVSQYNKKYGINRVDKYFLDQKLMSLEEKKGNIIEDEGPKLDEKSLREKIEQQSFIKAMHFINDNLEDSGILIKTGLVDFKKLNDAFVKEIKEIDPSMEYYREDSLVVTSAIYDFLRKGVAEDELFDVENLDNNDPSKRKFLQEKEEKAEALIRETHAIRIETEKKRRAESRRVEEEGRKLQIELINERRKKMGLSLFPEDYHKDADVQAFREERDVEIEKAKARHERNLKKREEKEARRQAKIQREKELQQRREEKKKRQEKEITEEEAKKAIKGKEVPLHMSNPNELSEKKSDEHDNRVEVPVNDAEMEPTMKKDGVIVNVASLESLKNDEAKKQEDNKSQSVKKGDEPSKTELSENQTLTAEEINTYTPVQEEQGLTDPRAEKKGIVGFFSKIKQKLNELFNRKSIENNIESTNVVPDNKSETNKKSQDFNSWVKVDTSQKNNSSDSRVNSNNTNRNNQNPNRENTDYEGPEQDL